jgi:hypothetical protein
MKPATISFMIFASAALFALFAFSVQSSMGY